MSIADKLNQLLEKSSTITHFPLLTRISPDPRAELTPQHLAGYRAAQDLALKGAAEIAKLLDVGWTEKQAAKLLDGWLHDHGVKSFFHHSFVWFGERTRFTGINRRRYEQFSPTDRRLRAGDAFILDVAPVLNGYTCDIGYSGLHGDSKFAAEFKAAQDFLQNLYGLLPFWFESAQSGKEVWHQVDQAIAAANYDNVHKIYPFAVLGHRIHRSSEKFGWLGAFNFGWHSLWALGSRGLFGQLLNQNFSGSLDGLWAIEPHIGTAKFGVKFEEILIVNQGKATWLKETKVN